MPIINIIKTHECYQLEIYFKHGSLAQLGHFHTKEQAKKEKERLIKKYLTNKK